MAKHDPLEWYPWYWQRWQRSRRVLALSLASRGLYRELLDDCWRVGFIPDDVPALAEIVMRPAEEVADAWPSVRRFFSPRPDGNLYHEGLAEIRREQIAKHHKNRTNGSLGGRPRNPNGTQRKPKRNPEKSIRVETTLNNSSAVPLRSGGVHHISAALPKPNGSFPEPEAVSA